MTSFRITSKADYCVLKIPCVFKIFSKSRPRRNSPATGVTLGAGSIFGLLSRSSVHESDFKNGHISRFYFVPNLSNFVGKVLLGRSFPKLELKNEISKASFWKRDRENIFLSNVLIRGCSFVID